MHKIVGYIDDNNKVFDNYTRNFKECELDLICLGDKLSKNEIIDWIVQSNVRCLIVDYKIIDIFDFNGTDLINFVNSEIPDLQCMIISSHLCQALKEEKVTKYLSFNRECLFGSIKDDEKFDDFINGVKEAINIFNNRLKIRLSEFKKLKDKKEKQNITNSEEERMLTLYKILRAYGEVDDIPAELLTTEMSKKVSEIIQSINKITRDNEQ